MDRVANFGRSSFQLALHRRSKETLRKASERVCVSVGILVFCVCVFFSCVFSGSLFSFSLLLSLVYLGMCRLLCVLLSPPPLRLTARLGGPGRGQQGP